MSSNENATNVAQDDQNTFWKEYMSMVRRCLEEEVEAVAAGGAVEWAELQMREQQLHDNITALMLDITNFKDNSTRKVESLVESLTAAVSNVKG